MEYGLLKAFKGLFEGTKYEHRKSNLGDHVVSFLYEDLLKLARSPKLVERVQSGRAVVNTANKMVGKEGRRGDGTFGEAVPNVPTIFVADFMVRRGRVASVEIGAEAKFLAKAMIKQIDRVINDLTGQVAQFRKNSPHAICVGVVGINHAAKYVSFEGEREFPTDGKKYKHPIQEAAEAERRLLQHAKGVFNEFIVLKYVATNVPPYPFDWLDEDETAAQYGAALTRVSKEYEARF